MSDAARRLPALPEEKPEEAPPAEPEPSAAGSEPAAPPEQAAAQLTANLRTCSACDERHGYGRKSACEGDG